MDQSISEDRPFISFQLGMRESLSARPSVVMFEEDGDSQRSVVALHVALAAPGALR